MFREICGILVFTFLIHDGQSTLPSGIVRCDLASGEGFKRQLQSILEVLRKDPALLHVTDVQPVEISDLFVLPGDFLNFEQVYKNVKLYNHNFNTVLNVSVVDAIESQVFDIYFQNPEVILVADYEFEKASLVGVPISSKGKVLYREQGVNGYIRMGTSFREVDHDNKKHLNIDNFTISYNPVRAVYEFASGDDLTDERITKVFNTHWEQIFADVGDSYEVLYAEAYKRVMQTIYDKFPCEELFLDFVSLN